MKAGTCTFLLANFCSDCSASSRRPAAGALSNTSRCGRHSIAETHQPRRYHAEVHRKPWNLHAPSHRERDAGMQGVKAANDRGRRKFSEQLAQASGQKRRVAERRLIRQFAHDAIAENHIVDSGNVGPFQGGEQWPVRRRWVAAEISGRNRYPGSRELRANHRCCIGDAQYGKNGRRFSLPADSIGFG